MASSNIFNTNDPLWRKSGILPIDSSGNESSLEILTTNMETRMNLIESCGDLLAAGLISSKNWTKLKVLIKSGEEENIEMVRKIINAKTQIDDE